MWYTPALLSAGWFMDFPTSVFRGRLAGWWRLRRFVHCRAACMRRILYEILNNMTFFMNNWKALCPILLQLCFDIFGYVCNINIYDLREICFILHISRHVSKWKKHTQHHPVPVSHLSTSCRKASLNSKGPDKRLEKVGGLEGFGQGTAGNEKWTLP